MHVSKRSPAAAAAGLVLYAIIVAFYAVGIEADMAGTWATCESAAEETPAASGAVKVAS